MYRRCSSLSIQSHICNDTRNRINLQQNRACPETTRHLPVSSRDAVQTAAARPSGVLTMPAISAFHACLRTLAGLCILISLTLICGCAKNYSPASCESLDPEYYVETYDPFETANRSLFSFNQALDESIVEPLARNYREGTPDGVQRSISNFFNNLKEPRNTTAFLLMGDVPKAANSTARFVANSVFGIAGLFDVASAGGMHYRSADFGQVFGYWGAGDGPYLVIPFLGPSNGRDIAGSAVHNRTTYVVPRIKKSEHQLFVQNMAWTDARAKLLPYTDILKEQPDPYLFARESYRQNRLNSICSS